MTKEQIHVQDRDIVVPGEVLATGMGYLPSKGTYRKGDDIIAERVGLITIDGKVIKLTPVAGPYLPKIGDVIVAKVIDVLMSGWRVNTNSPYDAVMSLAEGSSEFISRSANLRRYHDLDDYMLCKIVNVSSQMLIDVSMKGPGLRKLYGGRIINVDPMKVPRIIGKKASMVQMIKDATGVKIAVGQNGVIWMQGTPEAELIALDAINHIVARAHLSGLTDEVKAWLDENAKHLPKPTPEEREEKRGFREERGYDRGRDTRFREPRREYQEPEDTGDNEPSEPFEPETKREETKRAPARKPRRSK